MAEKGIVPYSVIEERIFLIRGQKVMIDNDLASLYGVGTKYLNQQVNRNNERFPKAFMFRLGKNERNELVANCNRFKKLKHSATMPRVFTEHGVAMLASVLRGKIAIKISISIIETFVKLRETLGAHKELAMKLNFLEHKIENHDTDISALFEAIRALMAEPEDRPKNRIGFREE